MQRLPVKKEWAGWRYKSVKFIYLENTAKKYKLVCCKNIPASNKYNR